MTTIDQLITKWRAEQLRGREYAATGAANNNNANADAWNNYATGYGAAANDLEKLKPHLSELSNSINNELEQRIATSECDKQTLTEERDQLVNNKNELEQRIATLECDKQTLTEERDQLVNNTRDPGQVRPSDYDFMNSASTKVWPITLQKCLEKDGYLKVRAKYTEYMQDWVAQRGDNLLTNHYDYLVYSSNVVWEKALMETMGDEDADYDVNEIKTKYLENLEFFR